MTQNPDPEDPIARAARLDAEGRHREAIDALAGAANRGSAPAKGLIGARLLIGDRAPLMAEQGAGLIMEAAGEGDAEAAARAAILCAAGIFRRADWAAALDWLARAAEAGLDRARAELAVLAGAGPGGESPQALRAAIDPDRLVAAPQTAELLGDPRILALSGLTDGPTRAWLTERARGRLTRAHVYDPGARGVAAHDARNNTTANFSLLDTDLVLTALQARIAAAAGAPFNHLEAPAILHYSPGERFADHFDFIDPRTPDYEAHVARYGQRSATVLVYLNADYEGGETAFPRLDVSHRGAAGDGLLFVNVRDGETPDLRTLHTGRAPASGEKWVVSQFIRSRPAMPGESGGEFFDPNRTGAGG